jgi:hypothetical protein
MNQAVIDRLFRGISVFRHLLRLEFIPNEPIGGDMVHVFRQILQAYQPPVRVVCVGLPSKNPKEWRFSTKYQAWMAHDVALMDRSVVKLLGVEVIRATYAELGLVSETARNLTP